MRKKAVRYILGAVLSVVLIAATVVAIVIFGHLHDINELSHVVCEEPDARPLRCGGIIGEPIDMGLSVKWSSINVGAFNPQDAGGYFSWGETEAKENYYWSTYSLLEKDSTEGKDINKYQTDNHVYENSCYRNPKYCNTRGMIRLEKQDNAAWVCWQGDWTMPTKKDWDELNENCTFELVNDYKSDGSCHRGFVVKSKTNSNSIFLPTFEIDNNALHGNTVAMYWTPELSTETKIDLGTLYGITVLVDSAHQVEDVWLKRFKGVAVRPICPAKGDTNGHDAIDLGLPSGNLWSTCNLGATTPDSLGEKYAWGEVSPKSEYTWENYKGDTAEFIGDGKNTLESEDDAASRNWGVEWRTPTNAEWRELYENTKHKWISDYKGTGVKGYILTSTVEGHTDASIFLPTTGACFENGIYGKFVAAFYWTANVNISNPEKSVHFYFDLRKMNKYTIFDSLQRCAGLPVRPVYVGER